MLFHAQALVLLTAFTASVSAWRVRLYDTATSRPFQDRSSNQPVDTCFNIPGPNNNRASYYDYRAQIRPQTCRSCRLRLYDQGGCNGPALVDIWQDTPGNGRIPLTGPRNNRVSSYRVDCTNRFA